jgi:murein DD-endopeptidase MepM/ murein hydrolase activator NlpD
MDIMYSLGKCTKAALLSFMLLKVMGCGTDTVKLDENPGSIAVMQKVNEKVVEEVNKPIAPLVKFSKLSDSNKRKELTDVVKSFSGKYVFVVPDASEYSKDKAFTLTSGYEFAAKRTAGKHSGVDVYDFGKEVVSFADGTIETLARNVPKISNSDHGNIIVINHGEVNGRTIRSLYLHVGAVADNLKSGVKVKKGEPIAKVDCTGIANKRGILYTPNSSKCKEAAHLHFQIGIDDSWVNPHYFFKEFPKKNFSPKSPKLDLSMIRGDRVSILAGNLGDDVRTMTLRDSLGSFRRAVKESNKGDSSFFSLSTDISRKAYDDCKPLFYSDNVSAWIEGVDCFSAVAQEHPKTKQAVDSKTTVGTLQIRIDSISSKTLYNLGQPLFKSYDSAMWCEARSLYQEVANRRDKFKGRANQTIKTLNARISKARYNCPR